MKSMDSSSLRSASVLLTGTLGLEISIERETELVDLGNRKKGARGLIAGGPNSS